MYTALFVLALAAIEGSMGVKGGYIDLGCWRNRIPQLVTSLEGTDDRLDKDYRIRADAIEKCYAVAKDGGYAFFAVANGGQCWAGHGNEYQTYGQERRCPSKGKGRYAVMNVYEIKVTEGSIGVEGGYIDLGCWRNRIPQLLTSLEGTDDRLDNDYRIRAGAIEKCYAVAKDGGYAFFAVANGGQCWAGHGNEYQRYGQERRCPSKGKGRYAIMNVYEIKASIPSITWLSKLFSTE